MSKRTNRIIAGTIGGMIGGVVMTLALMATRRLPVVRKISGELDQFPVLGAAAEIEDEPTGTLGKQLLSSAVLGGVYGALRSALRLPGILSGPAYGLVSYGLSWVGLGPAMERTPGPWNEQPMALLPRLVTHTVYGTVTDMISERVEGMLS
jgi:hypothetical protein